MQFSLGLLVALLPALVLACTFEGQKRQNGETWVVRKVFAMRCTINKDQSWKTEVVGCRSEEGQDIAIGQTHKEGTTIYACNAKGSGRVEVRKEVDPTTVCQGHKIGEKWLVQKNFNMECSKEGAVVANCLTDNGVEIAVNGRQIEAGTTYDCKKEENGTVFLHREGHSKPKNLVKVTETKQDKAADEAEAQFGTAPVQVTPSAIATEQPFTQTQTIEIRPPSISPPEKKPITCNEEGTIRQPEETWVSEGKFTKKCSPNGFTVILNCLIDKDTTINVDTEVRIGTQLHKCYKKGERVFYSMVDEGSKEKH